MKKSLAQLKRDANSGKLSAELVYRFGAEIPERLQGVRKITRSNSRAIFFQNADGRESECRILSAALCEYSENTIKIFRFGSRPLSAEESSALSAWNVEEEQYRIRNSQWTYANGIYWKKKEFFHKRGMDYLLGYEFVNGKKYDYATGNVFDYSVRGDLELEYKIKTA